MKVGILFLGARALPLSVLSEFLIKGIKFRFRD